jgi:predicted nucleotidyltransferase component of viral defense system
MKIPLLGRRELEVINRKKLRYPLAIAEKDYLLAVVSKVIYASPLKEKIIFKGGTAIHHCYVSQSRFSEDLDFTSLDKSITLQEVKTALESQDFLEVKKEHVSDATIKIERLKYSGPLGLPNSLKVEIDFLQNVALPAKAIAYKNVWGVKTKVMVMDIKEILAEKIRASSDRSRYRDFYDLALIMAKFKFDLQEIKGLIMRKEIRKPITYNSIIKNWGIAKKEQEAEQQRIYYSQDVTNSAIEQTIAKLSILNDLK